MLLTIVDVVSCENTQCRQFGVVVPHAPDSGSYYCQVCGEITHRRAVDASLAASPERYVAYLRKAISSDEEFPLK